MSITAVWRITSTYMCVLYWQPKDILRLMVPSMQEVGVTVQGAIVAVKYGKISRMSKVLLAQVQGAVGVLLYSDPADYGYVSWFNCLSFFNRQSICRFVKGPVYTTGPWGPASSKFLFQICLLSILSSTHIMIIGVEVGTIAYASICPGEPTFARMQNCLNDMTPVDSLLPDIPTQPISWADAYPIISNLQGPVVCFLFFYCGNPFACILTPTLFRLHLLGKAA